jgi:serine/threonine protein kinase
MVHHNFHTGNILIQNQNMCFISDIGLYGKFDNTNQTQIYGVMPYVAPEVLKGKSYTQAADIYSLGMVMYFIATGKQPFYNCAHDQNLALNICEGTRPELNESEAPKCYIDLMKGCWDTNPDTRPKVNEVVELIKSFYYSYKYDKSYESNFKMVTKIDKEHKHYDIEKQIKKAEQYRISNNLSVKEKSISHSQAIYTSRLLNDFTKDP